MNSDEIPIFDMNGPAFLAFYATLFVIATIWSILRGRSAVNRYDRSGYFPEIHNPYELAYLAAGAPRAAQLAVVRLIDLGLIEWKSGFLGKHLTFLSPASGVVLNAIERRLLNAIQYKGRSGLPVAKAYTEVLPEMRSLEVKLASLGLRPTAGELNKAVWLAVLPLILLSLIGLIKLAVGIARDKPVGYLMIFLFASLFIALFVISSAGKLTKTGQELLEKHRLENDRHRDDSPFNKVCWSFALLGPVALASIPAYAHMHHDLQRHIGGANASNADGAGDGGGSDGGGGCGGGGCGGCGGGD